MNRLLHDAWWRLATTVPRSPLDRLFAGLLQGAADVYGLGVRARNAAYDRGWARRVRLGCPVISVGNLTVGGTGKTTCVRYLAEKLRQQGRRVAILSRGYGERVAAPYSLMAKGGRLFCDDQPMDASSNGRTLSDEPQLLAAALEEVPVLVGRRREQTGRMALERFHPDVIVLDDGFQHRRLARDCEIVLVSARMPLGGWPLLPRGPMREPLASLRRADVIMLTKADESLPLLGALRERLRAVQPSAVLVTAAHEPASLREASGATIGLDRLAQSRVGLVSSIGDPDGFEHTIRRQGAGVTMHLAYPDHHRYTAEEWSAALAAIAGSGACALVTTEKDATRLRPFLQSSAAPLPIWILGVKLTILDGEEALDARLARLWFG
jgi:tetraacyldisaccharide 4'-kinase